MPQMRAVLKRAPATSARYSSLEVPSVHRGIYVGGEGVSETEAHSKSMKILAVRTERLCPSARREIGLSLRSRRWPRPGNMLPTLQDMNHRNTRNV